MKKILLYLTFTILSFTMVAQPGKPVHVKSYTKKNGTHVKAYNRSAPHKKR